MIKKCCQYSSQYSRELPLAACGAGLQQTPSTPRHTGQNGRTTARGARYPAAGGRAGTAQSRTDPGVPRARSSGDSPRAVPSPRCRLPHPGEGCPCPVSCRSESLRVHPSLPGVVNPCSSCRTNRTGTAASALPSGFATLGKCRFLEYFVPRGAAPACCTATQRHHPARDSGFEPSPPVRGNHLSISFSKPICVAALRHLAGGCKHGILPKLGACHAPATAEDSSELPVLALQQRLFQNPAKYSMK